MYLFEMKEDISVLIGRLSGLEAARRAIEAEIAELHRQIVALAGQLGGTSVPREVPPQAAPGDPSVLEYDSLGRIKRKRNLSDEEREKRRRLIAAARQKRLEKLHRASFVVSDSGKAAPPLEQTEK